MLFRLLLIFQPELGTFPEPENQNLGYSRPIISEQEHLSSQSEKHFFGQRRMCGTIRCVGANHHVGRTAIMTRFDITIFKCSLQFSPQ